MKDREMNYLKHKLNQYLEIDNVYTVFFNNMAKKYSSPGESHDFYEFVYVDSGEIMAEVGCPEGEKRKIVLPQGIGYLHSPNHYHRNYVENQMRGAICIVSFHSTSRVLEQLQEMHIKLTNRQREYLSSTMYYGSQMFQSINETPEHFIFSKYAEYNPLLEQLFQSSLEMMFLDILYNMQMAGSKIAMAPDNPPGHLVQKVKLYLQENVYNRISIEELCCRFSCSKTMLSEKFKKETGFSIIQYFNQLKIKKSIDLFENNKMTITEVSDCLNFSSCQYFSRLFKNLIGIYPREYKKSIYHKENVKFLRPRELDNAGHQIYLHDLNENLTGQKYK